MKPPVSLGYTVITAALSGHCRRSEALKAFCCDCLLRHASGDWGSLDPDDQALNDEARATGEGRIISSYPFPDALTAAIELPDDRLWIITYPGQETTLLFPSDY